MPERADLSAVQVRTEDWPAQAADSIVRVVGTVRDRTTGPALVAAKALVYGILVAVAGTALLVLLTIIAVRVLDNYLPDDVWVAHLAVGSFFSLIGLILLALSRRTPKQDEGE